MPKKNWTPEERKAWGEQMKARREQKARELAAKQEQEIARDDPMSLPEGEQPVPAQTEVDDTIRVNRDDYEALIRRIEEIEKRGVLQTQPQTQVSSEGVIGTLTKYSTNPEDYPDPRERLFGERDLVLQGFNHDWWELDWAVSSVNYDHNRVNITEPRFELKLIRVVPDEEGMPSNKRYVLHQAMFFEDPQAAIAVAREKGLEIPAQVQKLFLDEMRYLRMRDWLRESFYPPKPSQAKKNKTETVIGNRLVEVYEINSENAEAIPFAELNKKR